MHAIKAIYDGISFTPIQPIPVVGNYEVVITFVEPLKTDTTNDVFPAKLPRSTIKGLFKDKVKMSSDFNDPIDDMKEYME